VRTAGRRAEDRVERWLRARGLRPERFPPHRRRLSKTPDFRVATAAGAAFLVEVKTLTREQPSYGAVILKLLRARAQFEAVNQGGHLANVLALVTAAPRRLADVIDDVAPVPAGPLRGVDLVLGFEAAGDGVCVLHDAAPSRHVPLLTRVMPEAAAAPLLGDET
jgi:hypothetical protein